LNIHVFEEDTLTFVTVDLYYPKGKFFSQEFEGTSPPSQEGRADDGYSDQHLETPNSVQ
jgi:hypothetical protein